MIQTLEPPILKSRGYKLDTSPSAFGHLERFEQDPLAAPEDASEAFNRQGYLYMPGFWERDDVFEVRGELTGKLREMGILDPEKPSIEACPHPEMLTDIDRKKGSATVDGIADQCETLKALLFSGRIITFFERFLGGPILHFDYIWFRSILPGMGTVPHCDIVYMGRGTENLYTCWIPYGDIDMEMGGLMLLENSLDHEQRLKSYLTRDVDEYCVNRPLPENLDLESTTDNKAWGGWLARNPVRLRESLGGRWLTSPQYRMGDLLVFSTKLVHGSLDNQSDRVRLSTDTRYQLASEPADERWVGPGPMGHIGYHKRGKVC